jgi:hypothetical protein
MKTSTSLKNRYLTAEFQFSGVSASMTEEAVYGYWEVE